ncbi:MAG: ribosome silencing factor [Cyanobacteria bacterium J06607_10]
MAEKMIGTVPDQLGAPDELSADAISTEPTDLETVETAVLPVVDDEFKTPIDEEAKALALTIAEAADDRKAGDITILETGNISYLADYFVILTGYSNVQVRAIANAIEGAVEDKFDRQPLRTEGMSEGRWVLKDYGEVIVHIFMPSDREYYDLEAFWGHAERVVFTPTPVN